MFFTFYIVAAIINAVLAIASYFLYVRARLADRAMNDGHPDGHEHARRLAALDRKEKRYLAIHFITLSLFVLFGVLILVHLSARNNPRVIL